MRLTLLLAALAAVVSCKACVTLDRPLGFPCNPDASMAGSECPTSFRCGLEGRCHARDAGAAYPCHADSDCEGPWRCGLERVCHERDAGAAYACETDEDCEAQWRCGPAKRCVDATFDALVLPDAGFGAADTRLLFPNVPSGSGAVGSSQGAQLSVVGTGGCRFDFDARSYSWERDGVLTKHVDFPDGFALVPPGLPMGMECGNLPRLLHTISGSTQVPGPVVALADALTETAVLLADGQLCRQRFSPSTGTIRRLECVAPFQRGPPSHLRGTAFGLQVEPNPGYLAWSNDAVWWMPSDAGIAAGPFTIPGGVILDALATETGSGMGLIAFTSDALHLARWDGTDFVSPDGGLGTWGVQSSTFPVGASPHRALHQRGDRIFITSGDTTVVADRNPMMTNTLLLDFGPAQWRQLPFVTLRTCANDGNTDLTLAPSEAFQQLGVISRCASDAGRLGGRVPMKTSAWNTQLLVPVGPLDNYSAAPSSPQAWFFSAPTRTGSGHPDATVWADALGHLWSVDDHAQVLNALVPDRPVSWVGGDSRLIKVGTAAINWAQEKAGELGTGFLNGGNWNVSPDGGFEAGFISGPILRVGAVRGALEADVLVLPPALFARGVLVGDFSRLYATSNDTDTVRAPLDISLLQRGARRHLLWRSLDTVWLVTLEEGPPPGFEPGRLEQLPQPQRRLTPLVGQAITSMAWSPAVAADRFLDGYLVAGSRLFSFSALNERVWRNDEVIVGRDEPVDVFFDRGRARVGLRDGSLWSLPSRVQLAPAFLTAEGLAQGFANVCGQTLAVSASNVLRLEWDATQSLGTWKPLALPPGVVATSATPGPAPFASSRLMTLDRDALLVHDNGVAWRISFGGCP